MSARRLLRIVLSAVILASLWIKVAREWHDWPAMWLAGSLAISALLLLVLIAEVSGVQQKWRRLPDQVPKKPLGLDS